MQIQSYLFFNGRCEEAINFYRKALGAEVEMMMRNSDSPEPMPQLPPGMENKIMHASLRIGESTVMMTDGECKDDVKQSAFQGFSLSLDLPDAAAAHRQFDALAEGGQVVMPLEKTFWSPCFGMLKDRFGVSWMVGVHDMEAKG
ncbi:VOC family protein [Chitinimonas arctica]|uniref:VOC family protein n=1 Tax=Chitinimonas arctica TaxID=2594795 RepID=A0A516SIN9_9NEIS|nr:VOC family protein [Chitinimonas arctica]QDQ28016.1 VOC family protein [Chitinimonas arctica]